MVQENIVIMVQVSVSLHHVLTLVQMEMELTVLRQADVNVQMTHQQLTMHEILLVKLQHQHIITTVLIQQHLIAVTIVKLVVLIR